MVKNKNTTKILFGSIAVVLVLVIVVSVFFIKNYLDTYGQNDVINTKYTTDLYQLPSNPNDYQVSIYEDLAKECNETADLTVTGGLEDIAALVVKSYIADFFTWSNKDGSYDIGGLDYVYGPQHLSIQAQARSYYYNDLDLLIEKYGSDNLPTVKNITITSSNHTKDLYYYETSVYDEDSGEYVDGELTYDAYHVIATWEYETGDYDTSNLPTEGQFMVVNRDGRLEIAYYHENYY